MLLSVVPLALTLATAAAPQADAIAIAPQCTNTGDPALQLPELGQYLLPTRFEAIVPVNTSVWVLERKDSPHEYTLFDTTSNGVQIQVETQRTGLIAGVLVQVRASRELMQNHKIEVLQDGALIASFTPNVAADHTAPSALEAFIVPASQSFNSPCGTPGFHVQLQTPLSELGLVLVEDAGETIAVSRDNDFFVSSLLGSQHVARLVAIDLAGNRSTPSAETSVTADQAVQTNFSGMGGGRNTSVQPCTCVATRRHVGLGLAPLLLGAIGLLRRRRAA